MPTEDVTTAAIIADIARLTALVEAHHANKPGSEPSPTPPNPSIMPAPDASKDFAAMVDAAISPKPEQGALKRGRKPKVAIALQVALPETKYDTGKPAQSAKSISKTDHKPRALDKTSKSSPTKPKTAPVTSISLDELIDQAAQEMAGKKPAPISAAVLDNYASLIRGYNLGVPVLELGKLLTQVAGIEIKSGTFRNIFLKFAHENGDIKARKRGGQR